MKYYDFDKTKYLIEDNKENIECASLGMHEDWFWTGQTVFENGEYKRVLPTNAEANLLYKEYIENRKAGMSLLSDKARSYDNIMVSGLFGSNWATPTIHIDFKDGTNKMIPCYQPTEENEDFAERITKTASIQSDLLGVLSGPIQDDITPLSPE